MKFERNNDRFVFDIVLYNIDRVSLIDLSSISGVTNEFTFTPDKVRNYKRKKESPTYTEDDMCMALEDVCNGGNIHQAQSDLK